MRRSLALLVATGLVLAWLLSSFLSRGRGLLAFLLLIAPLFLALLLFARGKRRPLYALLYAMLLATAGALVLEAALRVMPGLLGGQLANVAYSGYHWQRGGVYGLDPNAGPVLRPSVSRRMYWSGHWWHHDTNERGWRGPVADPADAVFLGDSMIYGHGVEQDDTVPARFARTTGLATDNLGQQGTCLLQAYMILLRRGLSLKPKRVFACAHPTDIKDAAVYWDEAELRRFVDAPADSDVLPRVRPAYQPPAAWKPEWFWSQHVTLPTELSGVLGAAVRARLGAGAAPFVSRDPFVPTAAEIDEAVPGVDGPATHPERLGWQTQAQALAHIARLCGRIGAKLVVFDLGYPRAYSRAVEEQAHAVGAEYSPAGRIALVHAQAGERVYLADDGHWTGAGAAIVAAELAATATVAGAKR
jgi:hypothetical protein